MPRRRARKVGGNRPLKEKKDLYRRLMSQGMSNSAACRIVGVARRTGNYWRYGRKQVIREGRVVFYPPVVDGPASIDPRFLSLDERLIIADCLREGHSIRAIARELGRSPSTISREIRRNGDRRQGYRPHRAHRGAAERRARPKRGKLVDNPELRIFVQRKLEKRWSPEQISRSLPKLFPDRPEMRVAHETIYQALYVQGRGELRRELTRALRTGRALRKHRRRPDQRQGRFEPMVMISDRPAEIADRAVPGHWEGDLLLGPDNRSAIGTLVERSTRYVMLVHLPGCHDAESVRDALIHTVAQLPAHLTRSLTWDQGSEMGRHHEFTVATNIPVYFCDPASPWQRGTNENTNGLLRQYFPKGTNLAGHTPKALAAVAAELNSRPRKTLDWETPAERLHRLLTPTP
jgi:IS30 family transposase